LKFFLSPLVPHQRRHHCHQQPPYSWPSPAPNSHPEPQKRNLHCLLYLPLFLDLKIVTEDPILVNMPDGGGCCPHAWLYLVFSDLKIVAGGFIPANLRAVAVGTMECRKNGRPRSPRIFVRGCLCFCKRCRLEVVEGNFFHLAKKSRLGVALLSKELQYSLHPGKNATTGCVRVKVVHL
jgi:hypothetical protein